MLSRLKKFFTAPIKNSRSSNRARLSFDSLENRECPTVVPFVWQPTLGSTNGSIAANWSRNAVPGAGDVIKFVGGVSQNDCNLPGISFGGAVSDSAYTGHIIGTGAYTYFTGSCTLEGGTLDTAASFVYFTAGTSAMGNGTTYFNVTGGGKLIVSTSATMTFYSLNFRTEVHSSGGLNYLHMVATGANAANTVYVESGGYFQPIGNTSNFTGQQDGSGNWLNYVYIMDGGHMPINYNTTIAGYIHDSGDLSLGAGTTTTITGKRTIDSAALMVSRVEAKMYEATLTCSVGRVWVYGGSGMDGALTVARPSGASGIGTSTINASQVTFISDDLSWSKCGFDPLEKLTVSGLVYFDSNSKLTVALDLDAGFINSITCSSCQIGTVSTTLVVTVSGSNYDPNTWTVIDTPDNRTGTFSNEVLPVPVGTETYSDRWETGDLKFKLVVPA